MQAQRTWTSRHYAVGATFDRRPRYGNGQNRNPLAKFSPRILDEVETTESSRSVSIAIKSEVEEPEEAKLVSSNQIVEKEKIKKVPARQPRLIVQRRKKFERPSLSAQLEKIGKDASEITQQLTKTFGASAGVVQTTAPANATLLFQVPASSFIVGKLASKFPSPVQFYTNRCEYQFHHPYQAAQIHMVMYYRDMDETTLDLSKWILRFRIPHKLFHYGSDYDYRDARHAVEVVLSSEHDARQVAREKPRFSGGLRILRRR